MLDKNIVDEVYEIIDQYEMMAALKVKGFFEIKTKLDLCVRDGNIEIKTDKFYFFTIKEFKNAYPRNN